MNCRKSCGACCIEISISSSLPGMPEGKAPGVRCLNLSEDNTCRVHNTVEYPEVCKKLMPSIEMCGGSNTEAYAYLRELERLTDPKIQQS